MSGESDKDWNIPVAFYFQVAIGDAQIAFKEVSGLSTEMEVEIIKEGGVNEYEHRLPKQIKHGNLVLKRALMLKSEKSLIEWLDKILNGGSFFSLDGRDFPLTRTIQITLLSIKGGNADPIYRWECTNAFPVKWDVEPLDSEKNSVLIESLEFSYSTLNRIPVNNVV